MDLGLALKENHTIDMVRVNMSGKFGDKRVNSICRKLKDGKYTEPDKLIWRVIKEDRIVPNQLAKIISAIKESGTFNEL